MSARCGTSVESKSPSAGALSKFCTDMLSATGFFDAAPLELECPVCGASVQLTLGEGRRGATVLCAAGHAVTAGDAPALDRELRRLEERLDRTGHFGRLGSGAGAM